MEVSVADNGFINFRLSDTELWNMQKKQWHDKIERYEAGHQSHGCQFCK